MGRKPQINIVTAFTWFSNMLDICELDNSETVVLSHVLKLLNRNFWKPVKMSTNKLAKNLGKRDSRTIKAALNRLKEKRLIIESEKGEIYIGIDGAERLFKKQQPEHESEKQISNSDANLENDRQRDRSADTGDETLADYF